MDEYKTWQKLAAEFLGTAFLVFVGVGSVPALAIARGEQGFTGADLGFIALAFAAIVIVTVHVFGYVSGNHINPAVTIALAVAGKFAWKDVPAYVVAQLLGAVAGSFLIVGVLGSRASTLGLGIAAYGDGVEWHQALLAEFVGTFLLVFAVLGVVHRKANPGWAGLSIGFVVFAALIVVGPVTGGSINPARSAGPMLVQQILGGAVSWEQLPIYAIGQLLAGAAAAVAFGVVSRTGSDKAADAGARETLTAGRS